MSNENLTTKQRTALYLAIDDTKYAYRDKFDDIPKVHTEMANSILWESLGRYYFLGQYTFDKALKYAESEASDYLMKYSGEDSDGEAN